MSVISLENVERKILWDGQSFGAVGPYERVNGVLRFGVDPEHPANAGIVDLELASRGEDGCVRFDADFSLLAPLHPPGGEAPLLLDIPNRGMPLGMLSLNYTRAQRPYTSSPGPGDPDPGNAFLMRAGYAIASCGWQADVLPRQGLLCVRAPVALEDGRPLTGPVMYEFQPSADAEALPLGEAAVGAAVRPYPARDVEEAGAVMTVRDHDGAPVRTIPREHWCFAHVEDNRVVADPTSLHLDGGFEAGKQYTVVYTTEGAPIVGAGLLAIRDAAAWLKRGDAAAGNPRAGMFPHVYAFGVSQGAHVIRHLLYLGLNEDERGRQVFDGALPFIGGARRGEFNLRFGQPNKTLGRYVGALFPFSDTTQTEPLTGTTDGLLAGLAARGKVPKTFILDSAAEYWSRQASLLHLDVEGRHDLTPLATTRVYLMASTQHGGGARGPELREDYLGWVHVRHPENSVDYLPLLRAAIVNLERWVQDGLEPPPSNHPRLDDGTVVAHERVLDFFETVPGAKVPTCVPALRRMDFGPDTSRGVLQRLPPRLGAPYPALVPAIDEDGNDLAGIRHPDVAAPLATYTGWNLRHPSTGAPEDLLLRAGSTFPFVRTAAERAANGDPRRAIEERYTSREEYLRRVREAAAALVQQRWLLGEDVEEIVETAGLRWDLFTSDSR
jgi:Alpha/beta hydrolase domain